MGQRVLIFPQQPDTRKIKPGTPREKTIVEYVGWIYVTPDDPFPKECKITVWPDRHTGEIKTFDAGEYLAESEVSGVDQFGSFRHQTTYKRVGDIKQKG